MLTSAPGTYALILQSEVHAVALVGRWGRLDVEPGYYVYVGSALGPGGVGARVARHCRQDKLRHWHIDYLSTHLSSHGVWYCHSRERLEHRWADIFGGMNGMDAIPGFGSSDCNCLSHLFRSSVAPDLCSFSARAGGRVEFWDYGVADAGASSELRTV